MEWGHKLAPCHTNSCKFSTLQIYILTRLRHVTFKLGKFANFRVLFTVVSMDCALLMINPLRVNYPHTSSPNWSPYISLKNKFREFDKRSRHFYLGDHFINSHNLSVDNVWILLGENWSWSLLGLKGLIKVVKPSKGLSTCFLRTVFLISASISTGGRKWNKILII